MRAISRHFLFNSLNAVAALCRKDPEAAAELVGEISAYLQLSLEEKPSLIPLEEELAHLFSYLRIQQVRFPGRLKIIPDIEAGLTCRLPAFTLQPLADNAAVHGVLPQRAGGTVHISARKMASGTVRIVIQDDGVGMTPAQLSRLFKKGPQQHSLYRINQALKKAGLPVLSINSGPGQGTTVILEIPAGDTPAS
jgi:LytS/YehU family sensor histidine kinase